MDFIEFLSRGSVVLLIALLIYTYVQKFLCDPQTERGFHWRGMILKYSCWPVFFYAFLLALAKKQIPYIPTSKTAVRSFMNPFVKPLIAYCALFLITATAVYIERRYFTPESELLFSAQRTWGMLAFSLVAFLQSIGGIMASYSSMNLKAEDAWSRIAITNDKKFVVK